MKKEKLHPVIFQRMKQLASFISILEGYGIYFSVEVVHDEKKKPIRKFVNLAVQFQIISKENEYYLQYDVHPTPENNVDTLKVGPLPEKFINDIARPLFLYREEVKGQARAIAAILKIAAEDESLKNLLKSYLTAYENKGEAVKVQDFAKAIEEREKEKKIKLSILTQLITKVPDKEMYELMCELPLHEIEVK